MATVANDTQALIIVLVTTLNIGASNVFHSSSVFINGIMEAAKEVIQPNVTDTVSFLVVTITLYRKPNRIAMYLSRDTKSVDIKDE